MSWKGTSVAKEALERRADATLERYGLTTEAFDNARQDQPSQDLENVPEQGKGEGSQMVANDQPELTPKPPPEIARPVDREAFNEKWENEQTRADQERGEDYER